MRKIDIRAGSSRSIVARCGALGRWAVGNAGSRAALAAVALTIAMPASAEMRVPVMVGGEPELDACGGSGVVEGLDPNGDNFLSVRAGPATKARETDRVREGDAVSICDRRGEWVGIVYGSGTCGVSSPIARRQPYRGGCKSGWVHGRYVRIQAG